LRAARRARAPRTTAAVVTPATNPVAASAAAWRAGTSPAAGRWASTGAGSATTGSPSTTSSSTSEASCSNTSHGPYRALRTAATGAAVSHRTAPAARPAGRVALTGIRIEDAFRITDLAAAREIARAHPFATIVSPGLQMTRMPCLVDEEVEGLAILGHVARADPFAEQLGQRLLFVFTGPHGYVSASWYGEETIPTWNHVTLALTATPQRFADAMPVLRRTVERFERAVPHPWSLDRLGDTAREMADQVIAFRADADDWHAEAKLSQDKPEEERGRVLAGLRQPGPYAHPELAAAMRRYGAA
jgi:transcriptional regulator